MNTRRRADDGPAQTHWSVDKKIPLALIFALLVQFASVMVYVSTLKSQGDDNARRIATLEAQRVGERLAALETLPALLTRMDDKLTRLVERPRAPP